jgi:hypothetical protein
VVVEGCAKDLTTARVFGRLGLAMRTRTDLSIGRIVRYTDPAGQPHDAIVDGVVNGKVSIKYRPRAVPMALWVRPESLSIPR